MKIMSRTWIHCILFILFTFVSLGQTAPNIGSVPPPLLLTTMLQGPTTPIDWEGLKGKVVVLEFWSTACVPCVQVIPHWNKLVDEFQGRPVVFLCVSDDRKEIVRDFLKKTPIKGWIAEDGVFAATGSGFDVQRIPHTYIVDSSGKLAATTRPQKLTAEHLEEILAGKPSTLPVEQLDVREQQVDKSEAVSWSHLFEVSIGGPFPPSGASLSLKWLSKSHFEAKERGLKDALGWYFKINPKLIFEEANLPAGLFNITVQGPLWKTNELTEQFKLALQTAFDISVQVTNRELDVYVMTVCSNSPTGRRPATTSGGGQNIPGGFKFPTCTMRTIANFLTDALDMWVVDETQVTNRWQVDFKWDMTEPERLAWQVDDRIKNVVDTNPDLITSGHPPADLLAAMTDGQFALLKAELSKPREQQFRPDPLRVVKAAREQLGVELKHERRVIPVLVVRGSSNATANAPQ